MQFRSCAKRVHLLAQTLLSYMCLLTEISKSSGRVPANILFLLAKYVQGKTIPLASRHADALRLLMEGRSEAQAAKANVLLLGLPAESLVVWTGDGLPEQQS
jgi:hypothetical protein